MEDPIANPILSGQNKVMVASSPKQYHPYYPTSQSINFRNRNVVTIKYDGVFRYIMVWRLLCKYIDIFEQVSLWSWFQWDPYVLHWSFIRVSSGFSVTYVTSILSVMELHYPISFVFMSSHLDNIFDKNPFLDDVEE